MGCAQSKIKIEIENEESVCRCKDSIHYLKEAVTARFAFASALSQYPAALKTTGSALYDYYAQWEAEFFITPQPPLPTHSPAIPVAEESGTKISNGVILEEDEENDLRFRKGRKSGGRMATLDETPSPMADSMPRTNLSEEDDDDDDYIDEHHESKTTEEVVVGSSSLDFLMILRRIQDCLFRASEVASEAAIATQFADNRGQIAHVAKQLRRIRSLAYNDNWKDCAKGKAETHATVLDKLLACEKKLFEEVKARELMKLEYQRKVVLLNKLKKRGVSNKSLEKTKALVSHLHTRNIVDMQSLDPTVSEVNDTRDKQLYLKLVALVDGMSKMWDSICENHNQLTIVSDLKSLDVSGAPKETTEHHYQRTHMLYYVVQMWHSHFENLVTHQKHYIQALNSWLKLNLIPIESSLKEKISSPPRIQTPPIQTLLHSWHDHLQKLPYELAESAISSFAAVIETIMNHQEEEMKLKDKWEKTRKKYLRKNQAFEDWYRKYVMRRGPQEETGVTGTGPKDPIAKRQFVVESLKKRLEDEMEARQKLCVQVRDECLGSLKIQLPELVRAMSDYAHVCRDSYQRLRLIVHSQNCQNGS